MAAGPGFAQDSNKMWLLSQTFLVFYFSNMAAGPGFLEEKVGNGVVSKFYF